jgi:hypothetical protein
MTRSKVAAKYVNVLDHVGPAPTALRVDPRPPYTTIRRVDEDIDLVLTTGPTAAWFEGAMNEWDDRTMGDFVGRGLQGA